MKRAYLVLLLAAFLFFWNLWGHDLWAPDEPYFGEGAREMLSEGQWLVPHVNGLVSTDKPPLFFWLIAILSLPFGKILSLTARMPSALAMLGSVALTIRLGRRLWGEREGMLAGIILATTYLPWDKARMAQADSLLCFLILAAISAFEAFRAGNLEGRRAGFIFWCASALAFLTKGPVGILIPLGIALLTLLFDRNLRSWKKFLPVLGPLCFFIVIAAWALPATFLSSGDYSAWIALKKHFIERAIQGMHHKQPFYYYLEVMPIQLLPWTGLIPGAFLLSWKKRSLESRFLLIWALFVILFFSLSTEKRDLYTLPAYPALAILMSRLVAEWWEGHREGNLSSGKSKLGRSWISIPQGMVGGLLFITGLGLPLAVLRFDNAYASLAVWLAVPLAAGGISMLLTARAGNLRRLFQVTAGGFVVTVLVLCSIVYPALNPAKSARAFAGEVKELTAGSRATGHKVLAFGIGNLPEAIAFYTDGLYTTEVRDGREVAQHLSDSDEVFAVTDKSGMDQIQSTMHEEVYVRLSANLSRREIVLISNRF